MEDADILARRGARQPLEVGGIGADGRVEEKPVHGRQDRGQRIERLLGPRQLAKGAEHGAQTILPLWRFAQGVEGGDRVITGVRQTGPLDGEHFRPDVQSGPRGSQRLVRRSDRPHDGAESRRMEMTREEP
jgi:hypothetical protein